MMFLKMIISSKAEFVSYKTVYHLVCALVCHELRSDSIKKSSVITTTVPLML